MFDTKLLEILACPNCQGALVYDRERNELVCRFDHIAFPVEDEIPRLLVESSRKVEAA